jgi:hypothetical protein
MTACTRCNAPADDSDYCDACEDASIAADLAAARMVRLPGLIERHCRGCSVQIGVPGLWIVTAGMLDGQNWITTGATPLAALDALRARLEEMP